MRLAVPRHSALKPRNIIPAHVFKDSFRAFVELLKEHGVRYPMREARMGVPMASSGIIEIIQAVGVVSIWGGLAAVLVAFIKSRAGRKVIVTTKYNVVVQAVGLTAEELERGAGQRGRYLCHLSR